MLFQWIWFFLATHGVHIFHKPFDSLWQQATQVKDCPEKLEERALVYYIQCEQCPDWGSQIPRTQFKELWSPKTSNYFKHCQARGHNINSHNVEVSTDENHTIKYHIKEAIAITLYQWSSRDSNKIWNFVSNSFALNFRKLFYLLNWFFFLVLQDTSTSKNTFRGWMTAETMEY